MAEMFTASVDAAQALALFDRMAHSAQFVTLEVSRDTAQRIVQEALARVLRASGVTADEIHFELTRDGKGYVVLGYDARVNTSIVDYYLEYGTQHMRARPFFFSSGMLEEGPHLRRLIDRMQQWLDEVDR